MGRPLPLLAVLAAGLGLATTARAQCRIENFCSANPNSTGSPALIWSNGQCAVPDNSLHLFAGPVPGNFGLFFFSDSVRNGGAGVPFGGGLLCIGGSSQIFRLPVTKASGNQLDHPLDLTTSPGTNIVEGSTWYFQAWYRDLNGATSTYNTSDGLEVHFQHEQTPTVEFDLASQSVGEAAGGAVLTVSLSSASGLDVTVPYTVSGTAVSPDDYALSPDPLVIPAGDLSADLDLSVVDDALDEEDETVVVTLGTPVNADLGSTVEHTATLLDDDAPPVVAFVLAGQSVGEGGNAVALDLVLSQVSGLDVTLPYTLAGTATEGSDYTIDASPALIPAGQTSASVTLTPVQDSLGEGDEEAIVDLGTPTNATLGSPASHVVTLVDDDCSLESDDFNDCAGLVAPWSYVDPIGDGSLTVTGVGTDDAWLRLSVPGGSDHEAFGTSLPARAQQPYLGEDCQFRVRFDALPTTAVQEQGLLVIEDDQRWLRFDVLHDGTGLNAFVGSTTGGVTTVEASVPLGSVAAPLDLRLTRAGDTWTAEWSDDGATWTPVVSFPLALGAGDVGIYAGNAGGAGAPPHEAAVDLFEVTADPLGTEDGWFPGAGPYTLDVSTSGTGTGSVTLDPNQPDYLCTEVVTLTAAPDAGSTFVEWQGAVTGSANPVQVTMSSDRTVVAVFDDVSPPVITNVQVSAMPDGAVVTWDTDEPATSRVDYGTTSAYGSFEEDPTLVTAHSVVLSGLQEVTTYHFQVCSTDAGSNTTCTPDGTFTTPPDSGLVSDDFNHCGGLLAPWSYVDTFGDGSNHQVSGVGTDDAWLLLSVPGGTDHDPFGAGPLPPRVVQPVYDVDFEFEVKLESGLDASVQQQGVLIEQDEDDWIRFDLYRSGGQDHAFVGNTAGGGTTTELDTVVSLVAPMYLRVTRVGDDWTCSTSDDGIQWMPLVTFTRPLVATQVALYAGNAGGSGAPSHTAAFDWFQDTAKPLAGEDGDFPGSGPFILTTQVTGSGTVTRDPDQAEYHCTDVVTLTAVPDPGWSFDHWEGDLGGSQNPEQLTMSGDRDVTAVFVQDVTPPTISNLQVTAGRTTALVTWDTDEPATSRVEYGLDTGYGSVEESLELVTSHGLELTGLDPGTPYHFRACSTDAAGLTSCTSDGTFTTQEAWAFVSDDFNQCSGLSADWSFVDPLADATLEVVGVGTEDAQARISVPAGTEHQAFDTIFAPYVVQAVNDVDFQLEVKLDSLPAEAYGIQGVLVKQGEADWLRFDVYHDGVGLRVYAGATVSNDTTQINDVGVGAVTAPLWLRITRSGDQWTYEHSFDGTSWITTVAGVTEVLAVSEVGLYVGNAVGSSSPSYVGAFDYAFDTEAPIDPEDGTFSGSGPFTLTTNVDPTDGGGVTRSPDQPDYSCTEVVEVTAVPNPGWRFDHWSGDLSGGENPEILAMTVDRSVTAHFAPDTDPPVITDVQVSPGPTFATVTWTTDEPADSRVDYGTTASYGQSVHDGTLVTQHVVQLTGLTSNTTYHFQVCSEDISTNQACNGDHTFTTTPDGGVVSDDFNHANVDLGLWTPVDPLGEAQAPRILGPCTSDALLELRVPQATEYLGWIANEHLRLTQPVQDTDFELEAKLQTDFTAQYQSAGILVEEDADTWLRFSFQHTGSGLRVLRASFDAGAATNVETTTVQGGDWIGQPLWMRVTRVGDQWTQSFSTDGTNWFSNAGSFSFACSPAVVGVMAGNELPENNALNARFDYFFNTVAPIDPEDFGCPPDETAPLLVAGGRPASDTSVRVEWSTDEWTTGSVSWGTSPGVYDQGPLNGDSLVYDDELLITGLIPDTTYHVQVTVTDGGGHTTLSPDLPLTTGPPGFDGLPDFEIWYGTVDASGDPVLRFGHLGNAQTWCNVPGRVTDDFGEVVSLSYTLDDGSSVSGPFPLSIEGVGGLDVFRLQDPGDFNVELDHADLADGMNELTLTATDDDGNVVDQTVWVDYTAGNTWPLPYSVDWSTVTDLQDAVQFVDGYFRLDSSSGTPRLRNARDGQPVYGYDRLFAIGDEGWTDYEFLFDFEVHSLNPDGFTPGSNSHAFGVIARWPGHSGGSEQPQEDFFPIGGLMAYRWYSPTDEHWNAYSTDFSPNIHLGPFFMPVDEGVHYLLRGQVDDLSNGDTLYRLRLWENGAPEPGDWFLEMTVPAGGLPSGSLLFIVHDVDASIGDLTFTPL